MSKLKFSDGVEFETSGNLRVESRKDGLSVVGNGMLMPVSSYEEGSSYIKEVSNKK